MILISDNEIDKKIAHQFSDDVIKNITPDTLDFFGINLCVKENDNMVFKIYYSDQYSRKNYELEQYNDYPLIQFLIKRNMLKFLSMVHDEYNSNSTRFDIGITNRTNENMLALFNWLEQNIDFWDNYKQEIMTLSTMHSPQGSDSKYSSLYYIGFINKGNGIDVLKCHWINEIYDDNYYLDFIEKNNINGLKDLLPIVRNILPQNKQVLCLEGIDYNKTCSEKHKIYLNAYPDILNKLAGAIPDGIIIENQIKQIQKWMENHPDFKLEGLAIGKNDKNVITLNIYFRMNSLKK